MWLVEPDPAQTEAIPTVEAAAILAAAGSAPAQEAAIPAVAAVAVILEVLQEAWAEVMLWLLRWTHKNRPNPAITTPSHPQHFAVQGSCPSRQLSVTPRRPPWPALSRARTRTSQYPPLWTTSLVILMGPTTGG